MGKFSKWFGRSDDSKSSYGWGGYSSSSFDWDKYFKPKKMFVDKSHEMKPIPEGSIDEHFTPNKYGIKLVRDDFDGCLFWIKDINQSDENLMNDFGKQATSVSKYISGLSPLIDIKKDRGSSVSYDGKSMKIEISSMYDYRIEKNDRIDIFFANLLHEVFHLKYTIPHYRTMLIEKGYTVEKLNKYGKIIKVADFSKNLFSGDRLLATVFNICEDYRIEKLGLRENPGYVGYFDKMLAYYSWLASGSKKEALDRATFLHYYLEVVMLLPSHVKGYLDKAGHIKLKDDLEHGDFDLINKYIKEAKESETFKDTYDISNKIYILISKYGAGGDSKGGSSADADGSGKDYQYLGKNAGTKIGESSEARSAADAIREGDSDAEASAGGVEKSKELPSKCKIDLEKKSKCTSPNYTTEKRDPENCIFDKGIYNKAKGLSRYLSKDLEFLNSKFTAVEESFELDSGDLDEDEIYGVKFNKDLFKDEEPAKEYSMDLFLLVDQSGSMGGGNITKAMTGALAMFLAFSDVPNINVYLYGHQLRCNSVSMYRYYDEKNRIFDINRIFGMSAGGTNADGYAILESGEILKKGSGASKVLIVLSDGQPNYSGSCSGTFSVEHTAKAVQELERKGVFVVQVAIAHVENSSKMFKHFIPYSDGSDLGKNLTKILKTQYQKIANNA